MDGTVLDGETVRIFRFSSAVTSVIGFLGIGGTSSISNLATKSLNDAFLARNEAGCAPCIARARSPYLPASVVAAVWLSMAFAVLEAALDL